MLCYPSVGGPKAYFLLFSIKISITSGGIDCAWVFFDMFQFSGKSFLLFCTYQSPDNGQL
jgi:hypothetical protein